MGMFVMERLIQQLLAGRVRQGLPKRPGVFLHSWPLLHSQLSPPHLPIQPQYKAQNPKYVCLLYQLCSDRQPSHLHPCTFKKLFLWLWTPPPPSCSPLSVLSPRVTLLGLVWGVIYCWSHSPLPCKLCVVSPLLTCSLNTSFDFSVMRIEWGSKWLLNYLFLIFFGFFF